MDTIVFCDVLVSEEIKQLRWYSIVSVLDKQQSLFFLTLITDFCNNLTKLISLFLWYHNCFIIYIFTIHLSILELEQNCLSTS